MGIVPFVVPVFPTVAQDESPFCPEREAVVVLGDDSAGVGVCVRRSGGTGDDTGEGNLFDSVLKGGVGAVNEGCTGG